MRESFCESPQDGNMPNLACVSINLVPLAATIISQASAISNPAVTANPAMAPTIGFPHRSICATGSPSTSLTSPLNTSSAAVRSTPEQKARPEPDRMMTRTESSAARPLKACAISLIIDLVNEFRDFGRLIVTPAMPPESRVTKMRFSGEVVAIWGVGRGER
uniref:Uncharacterized protein n=1 Tax=Opuntia streptacantha TaxID=393608 RepID=A0A7C9CH67_OPUST